MNNRKDRVWVTPAQEAVGLIFKMTRTWMRLASRQETVIGASRSHS
jgi:hypothetical protein